MLDRAALSGSVCSVRRHAFLQYFDTLSSGLEQVVCLQIPTILPGIVSLCFFEGSEGR